MLCCAKRSIAFKVKLRAKRRYLGLQISCYTVLRSSTLCYVAARSCAAKQFEALLQSSTLRCWVAARGAKHRLPARKTGGKAQSAKLIKIQAALTMLHPLVDLFGVVFANLVPH